MAQILVIDDEPKMTALICGELEDASHRVTTCTNPTEALALIEKHSFDVVITDYSMPEVNGMQILEKAIAKPATEVIMMTAYGKVETAVEALKKGAADYLLKPFSLEELVMLVDKLVKKQKLTSLSSHYEKELKETTGANFVGSSDEAKKVRTLIAKVAVTDSTVLLTGRSGTGKEVAARMIHEQSPRSKNPYIAVNCAALPDTLLESELFGHEKGAFTGADARKQGRFELAESGTLFLDEIGEMKAGMQSKLLRVLEERQLVRVGGVDTIDIDIRLILATNRDLKEDIVTGRFREDLFFRINVFPINLPLLAERGRDVIELARHFLEQANFPHSQASTTPVINERLSELLLRYDWPGNVRELRNLLERAVILSGGETLSVEDFDIEIDDAPLIEPGGSQSAREGLEMAEKEMILSALKRTNNNKTEAAQLLKITRRRLYSRMKVHDIKL